MRIPEFSEPIRRLPDLTRARPTIVRERVRESQRLRKFLEDAGIKLSSVATNLTGVSGQAMLEALREKERGPKALVELAKRRLRNEIPELTEALQSLQRTPRLPGKDSSRRARPAHQGHRENYRADRGVRQAFF